MKTIKTTLTAMLLLFLMVSCSKEEHNPLLGKWKCLGFGEITNTGKVLFKEIEPKSCERCYTLTFREESFGAINNANTMGGKYTFEDNFLLFYDANIRTRGDTIKDSIIYEDILTENTKRKIEVKNDTLKLYYSTNKYLLFKLKNKLK